jgi:hypothetical protein
VALPQSELALNGEPSLGPILFRSDPLPKDCQIWGSTRFTEKSGDQIVFQNLVLFFNKNSSAASDGSGPGKEVPSPIQKGFHRSKHSYKGKKKISPSLPTRDRAVSKREKPLTD